LCPAARKEVITDGSCSMLRALGAGCLLLTITLAATADNWPGWRGPAGSAVSSEASLPVSWSKTEGIAWQVALPGAGVSTPIVWGDRVFLTSSDSPRNDQLHMMCFAAGDGRKLWHVQLFGTAPTDLYPPGGMAVPTPA